MSNAYHHAFPFFSPSTGKMRCLALLRGCALLKVPEHILSTGWSAVVYSRARLAVDEGMSMFPLSIYLSILLGQGARSIVSCRDRVSLLHLGHP